MKVAIAADHAGFKMKDTVADLLKSRNFEVLDFGTNAPNPVDYPDFAKKAARAVSSKKADLGILVCGSGIGMCMAANRFKGVRAVVLNDEFDAQMSRRHNDSNIACLGARKISEDIALRLIEIWLNTPFEGGRHQKRIEKID